MGQLLTTVAGAAIGFAIGGPAGAQIGMMLGGMAGSALFGPTLKGPRLNDLRVSSSAYGLAIPELYGTVRTGGNLIWSSGIKETKHTARAGKGGPKHTYYTYDASFAMGLCKGPITEITRIWADGKLIYDNTGAASRKLSPGTGPILDTITIPPPPRKKKPTSFKFRLYTGTEDQLPDSLIEASEGVGNVSAHRGMAYIVFENMPLEDYGNRLPQLTFEVSKNTRLSFPSVIVDSELPGGAGSWAPMWDTGRLFASGSSVGTYAIDLDTMKIVQHTPEYMHPSHRGGGWLGAANVHYLTRALSNSDTLEKWDLNLLAKVGEFGQRSRSTSGYHWDWNYPGTRRGDLGLSNLGHACVTRTSGGIDHLVVLVSWTRYVWILTSGGLPQSFYRAPWVPEAMFEGPVGSSIAYGWRNYQGAIQLHNFVIFHQRKELDLPEGLRWEPVNMTGHGMTFRPYQDEAFKAHIVLFDPTDSHIFVMGYSDGVPCVFKYSPGLHSYKFIRKHPELNVPGIIRERDRMIHSRLAGGTFGWLARYHLHEIDLQTGDLLTRESLHHNSWRGMAYAGGNQHWDDVSGSLVMGSRDGYRRVFFRRGINGIGLRELVEDICLKSGVLTNTELDMTQLTDHQVPGYIIDRECSSRDALKQLASAYLFDGYESDYKLKFRSRGGASQGTIAESWLGRSDDGQALTETLTQEFDLPLKVSLNHYDLSRDHQQGTQSAKRNASPYPTMWTRREDVTELPIVWTPDDAKQCADKLLKMVWANRTGYGFTLPWRFLKYDPTDIVMIATSEATYNVRLTSLTVGADFSIEARAVSEKATAYTSNAKGNPGEAPVQYIETDYPAYTIVLNTPLLRDEDFSPSALSRCYVSVATNALRFSGATVYMNDGIEFKPLGEVPEQPVGGYAINALPYTTAYEATDEKNVLRVRLTNPQAELESITQEDMLNTNANAALVGEEIIQFREAVQQPNGEWWLRGLHRARRGTNYALRNHRAGEPFLLLSEEALLTFQRSPEQYETERSFRAVTTNGDFNEAITVTSALKPRDLMPYTPEGVKISDDGTTVTLTMNRRSRLIAPLTDRTGDIHYREGDRRSARIAYSVWPGRTLAEINRRDAAPITGTIALFDSSGQDIDPTFSFALSELGNADKCLIKLTELGAVEGIPKWIEAERLGENRWNTTDFY